MICLHGWHQTMRLRKGLGFGPRICNLLDWLLSDVTLGWHLEKPK